MTNIVYNILVSHRCGTNFKIYLICESVYLHMFHIKTKMYITLALSNNTLDTW